MKKPIETKVISATGGAIGGGGVISTFALWLLGAIFWHGGWSADTASTAIGAVPGPVQALTIAVVAGISTYVAGYLAPHTSTSPSVVQNIQFDPPKPPEPTPDKAVGVTANPTRSRLSTRKPT